MSASEKAVLGKKSVNNMFEWVTEKRGFVLRYRVHLKNNNTACLGHTVKTFWQ